MSGGDEDCERDPLEVVLPESVIVLIGWGSLGSRPVCNIKVYV